MILPLRSHYDPSCLAFIVSNNVAILYYFVLLLLLRFPVSYCTVSSPGINYLFTYWYVFVRYFDFVLLLCVRRTRLVSDVGMFVTRTILQMSLPIFIMISTANRKGNKIINTNHVLCGSGRYVSIMRMIINSV